MDDQKDNALSINTCIQYTLVVFETRHTKAVFLLQTTTCVTGMSETQNRYNTSSKCPHISRPHFSPLKSHFYMFVGTLLPLAAHKCFLYHLIGMLNCFTKRVSQRKYIFEHFSPHFIKVIQN